MTYQLMLFHNPLEVKIKMKQKENHLRALLGYAVYLNTDVFLIR